jgi:hypothetical protein
MEVIMDKQTWKIVLLACLWWEVCVGLDLENGTAFVVAILLAGILAMVGAGGRMVFERVRTARAVRLWADHPFVVIAAMVTAALALVGAGIVDGRLLVGAVVYALPPAVPVLFGWRMTLPAGPERTDAKLGSARMFRAAGFSDER